MAKKPPPEDPQFTRCLNRIKYSGILRNLPPLPPDARKFFLRDLARLVWRVLPQAEAHRHNPYKSKIEPLDKVMPTLKKIASAHPILEKDAELLGAYLIVLCELNERFLVDQRKEYWKDALSANIYETLVLWNLKSI